MKKLVTAAMAVALVIGASTAMAQDTLDIGIFADPAGTQSTTGELAGQGSLYVVAFGLDTVSLSAYEMSVTGIPASLLLFPTVFWPATAIAGPGGDNDFIAATGGCVQGDAVTALVTIPYFVAGPIVADTAVCIGAAEANSVPGAPGFGRCDVDPAVLVPFGIAQNGGEVYPDGCLILNATDPGAVVDTETSSFGEIKARF